MGDVVSRSGFCSPAFGTRERAVDHQECQKRLDDGRIGACDCSDHPTTGSETH